MQLAVSSVMGTTEGGPFESSGVVLLKHDASHRVDLFAIYDEDQLDDALARYVKLVSAITLS